MITLDEILEAKKEEINNLKMIEIKREKPVLDVEKFLKNKPIIAEIKKSSPSKGEINKDIDIIKQAKKYEKFGAGMVSVLTDEKFFSGSFIYLKNVARNVEIPVLCKDFILSEIQIENAYRCGADVILLIVSIIEKKKLDKLTKFAKNLNLKILFEIHEINDFLKIKDLNPEIVGVNSRDFNSMKVNKEKAINVLCNLRGNFLKVAESGIESKEDIIKFKKAGADAFLIGTAFMESEDLKEKFRELRVKD